MRLAAAFAILDVSLQEGKVGLNVLGHVARHAFNFPSSMH